MYYNYTDEQKYFLSITDAMLKDDFSVKEIVEFWNSEDQEQIEGILGSLTLTESVDYSNPDLAVVCEKFGFGWLSTQAGRLLKRLRGINPKTGNPRITGSTGPTKVQQAGSAVKTKVKQGTDKVKAGINKLPPGAKTGLAVAGAGLGAIGVKDTYDAAKDALDSMNTGSNDPDADTGPKDKPKKEKKIPVVYKPTLTSPDPAGTGPKWWQSYERAAPYHSSKKYYRGIRDKYK